MFKVYEIKTPVKELNGKWGVEIASRTGIIHIKKPMENGEMSSAVQVGPGYNGKEFNQRFRQMPEDEQMVIKKLVARFKSFD